MLTSTGNTAHTMFNTYRMYSERVQRYGGMVLRLFRDVALAHILPPGIVDEKWSVSDARASARYDAREYANLVFWRAVGREALAAHAAGRNMEPDLVWTNIQHHIIASAEDSGEQAAAMSSAATKVGRAMKYNRPLRNLVYGLRQEVGSELQSAIDTVDGGKSTNGDKIVEQFQQNITTRVHMTHRNAD